MGQLTQFTSVVIIILVWCYKVGITGERCLGSNTEEGIASVTFALFVNLVRCLRGLITRLLSKRMRDVK